MTTTVTKVDTKWDLSKVQHTTANIMAAIYMSAYEVLAKHGEKALEEFDALTRKHKVEHYKTMDIKTPLDMVRAVAETEHNVYGSQIEIWGDDKQAHLKYNSCGVWEAMQKKCKFTPEQEEKMGAQCAASWTAIAKEFGFKYEPKMSKDSFEMIFSR